MYAVSISYHLNAISDVVVVAVAFAAARNGEKVHSHTLWCAFARASVSVNLFGDAHTHAQAHTHSQCVFVIECVCLYCFYAIFFIIITIVVVVVGVIVIVISGTRVCSPLRLHFFARVCLFICLHSNCHFPNKL